MAIKGVVGSGFLILATVFFLLAGARLIDANTIAWTGVKTTGTITGHKRGRGKGNGWDTVYRFNDQRGLAIVGSAPTGIGGDGPNARARRKAQVGRKVSVIYDPADPARSVMNSFWGRWNMLFVMLFVLPHMAIGYYLVRSDRRDQREDGWFRGRF